MIKRHSRQMRSFITSPPLDFIIFCLSSTQFTPSDRSRVRESTGEPNHEDHDGPYSLELWHILRFSDEYNLR